MYRRFNKTRPIIHHHRVRPGNLFNGAAKGDHQEACKLILRTGGFHIGRNFLGAIGYLMQATEISKTPLSVSMEQQTRPSLGRITMQCYMHTLRYIVPVHHKLDLECMLMIASIV